MSCKGLTVAVSTVLILLPRAVGTTRDDLSPVLAAESAVSSKSGDPCPCCAKYSRAEYRRHVQDLSAWCSNRMSPRIRKKLCAGFQIAVGRLCKYHECHELFSRLDADGIDTLAETLYYPADPYREVRTCSRAMAFSRLDGSQTWLCRRFATMSDEGAGITLIHEALHRAGLGNHSWRMSSGDTDREVKLACGFVPG